MAALFTLLLGIAGAIFGYFLYDFGKQDFIRETEAVIDAEIATLLAHVEADNPASIRAYIESENRIDKDTYFSYQALDGKILAGNLAVLPQRIDRIAEGILQFNVSHKGHEQRVAAKFHTFADGSRVMVARDIHSILQSYERFKQLSILIFSLMAAVVLVSFIISYFVVSRTNMIAATAQDIMDTGDLSRRISINTDWDDLSNLAQVLNALLARVESLMQGVREVSNNIAHDLRTPLTRLRNQIEDLKKRPVSAQDMDDLLTEADHLLAIFQSLLRIANIEKGQQTTAFAPVEMGVLLQDVAELYEPLAEEKNIHLTLDRGRGASIKGDRHLLFQLFANLLDNAIKFSPPGGVVLVRLQSQDETCCVTVADSGPGVPASEYERVFNRFYRGDASRHTTGNGLGLSLVKAVVELHHGRIELADNQPGLRVTVRL